MNYKLKEGAKLGALGNEPGGDLQEAVGSEYDQNTLYTCIKFSKRSMEMLY